MVTRVWVRNQVQTGEDSAPALLMVADSPLDERLTNSLECPPIGRNSQVILRIRRRGRRGGPRRLRLAGRFDRERWADVPQPAGDLNLSMATFAVRSVIRP